MALAHWQCSDRLNFEISELGTYYPNSKTRELTALNSIQVQLKLSRHANQALPDTDEATTGYDSYGCKPLRDTGKNDQRVGDEADAAAHNIEPQVEPAIGGKVRIVDLLRSVQAVIHAILISLLASKGSDRADTMNDF